MRLIFLLSFFITFTFSAQEKSILISKQNTRKQIKIKEGKRIRVKTLNGKRLSGRFKILNDSTIFIKNKTLKFSEIEKIKRNPLAMTLPLSIITGTYGGAMVLIGIAFAVAIDNSAAVVPLTIFMATGTGLIYSAIRPPNILKGYSYFRDWKYDIVTD